MLANATVAPITEERSLADREADRGPNGGMDHGTLATNDARP
jgi:hypothetical protein